MLTNRSRRRHAHASQRQRDEDEENLHHSTPKPSWTNSHSRTKKKNIFSSSPPVISVAFFGACLILISVTAILLLKNQHQHTKFLQLKDDSPVHEDEDGKDHHLLDKQVEFVALAELEAITSKLLGPDDFGNGCPPGCGCKGHPVDCPQHYSAEDVIKSADAILDVSSSLYYASQLELQHADAMKKCMNANNANGRSIHLESPPLHLESRGYCLSHRRIEQTLTLPDTRIINIPKWHVLPSDRIVETLEELFRAEGVISVSDFGAGVGQYGVYLKSHIPGLIYQAYDGAGDIESYTNGFVKYSDFTQPLDLPITEWVLSLEVGEHIPSKYEGIFIRNLHRHNCKGLILSWGVLGQDGENHINLHSNTYVMNIFHSLGYLRDFELEAKLRNPEGNHKYFVKSAMAFRRRHVTCGRPVPALRRISTIAIAQNNSSIDPTSLKAPIVSKNRMPEKSFDLIKTPAADRDLDGLTVDLAYTLNVPSNWWDGLDTSPSYNSLMMSLHGKDIWRDDRLLAHLDFLGIKGDTHEIFGSPLKGPIEALLRQYKPKIFLEVGVFRGATSTKIATFFKEEKEGWAKDSYVLSMDTWLLDLAFAWNGGKSTHADKVKNEEYFKVNKISGGNQMYFQFLSNCLATKTNDRIIPIQTASLNGAIALLSHGIRPDFMYIDASHANPGTIFLILLFYFLLFSSHSPIVLSFCSDVFLDYENFYKILKPGGVMTFDDVKSVPACRDAFNMLARKYDLKQYFLLEGTKKQGYIIKKDEKETKNVHSASASTGLELGF